VRETKIQFDLLTIRKQVDAAIEDALGNMFLLTARSVRANLSKPGTGKVYRVAKGKKKGRNLRARGLHRASAPGYPPAVDTNRLRASWIISLGSWKYGYAKIKAESTRTVLNYGSTLFYAPLLEYGTSRMKQRPYLRPAFDKVRPLAEKTFQRAFNKHFPKGGRA
jgi:HK97 gp10 family phage protein